MQKKKVTKKLIIRWSHLNYLVLALVIALVVGIGTYLITSSRATGPYSSVEAESGTLSGGATATTVNGTSGGKYVKFASASSAGGICGSVSSPPAKWKHVIWIWDENHNESTVTGNSAAPYINNIGQQCGEATNVLDSATTVALQSEPQYAAATSGSNCNVGISSNSSSGTGCIVNDNDNQSINTQSIFQLAKSSGGTWKSYQEGMQSNCALASGGSQYAFKHNPGAFYSQIRTDCASDDIPIASITCPTAQNTVCSTPSNQLVTDAAAGTLPTFAFITPNLDNDMHDGSVTQGDNWLKTYLPLLINGVNYKAGDTAIFIMTDEGSSNSGPAFDVPTTIISPSTPKGTISSVATNNIGILRTTQEMLGLTPLLGCAGGTPPGATTGCNPNSNVSIKASLNL